MLGIHVVLDTAFGVLVMMSVSAWCMAKITLWMLEGENGGWLTAAVVQAGCMAGFCNVFIAEWYQFTETLLIYASASVCCVFAARRFTQNKKLAAFLLLSAGYNFYQSAMAFFVFLVLMFLFKKYEFRFQIPAVKETIAAAFVCALAFVVNFLITKLLIMMNIPVLGVVENFSYLKCPDCGKEIRLFGESHVDEAARELGIPVLGKIPLDPEMALAADRGIFYEKEHAGLDAAVEVLKKL